MPISLSCPECDRGLKVKDELAGRKIKCPKCGGVVVVPAAASTAVTAKPKARPSADDGLARARKAARERADEDEDEEEEEEERPKKKKKKKKRGTSPMRYIIGGVVLVALIVVLVVVLMNKKDAPVKKVEEPVADQKEPEVPKDPVPQEKAKPIPKTLAQNIRQAALRPERLNELKQIGLYFKSFVDERNGKNPKTDDEFIDTLKIQAPVIAKQLKEKHYILNLKVNMRAGSGVNGVIAFETAMDGPGYQSARTDGSVTPLSGDDLRKLLPDELKKHAP